MRLQAYALTEQMLGTLFSLKQQNITTNEQLVEYSELLPDATSR